MHQEGPQSLSFKLPVSGCELSIILYGIESLSDEDIVEARQLVVESMACVDDVLDVGDITIVITPLRASAFIIGFDYSGDVEGLFPESIIYELDPDRSDTAIGLLVINEAVDEFMDILLGGWENEDS